MKTMDKFDERIEQIEKFASQCYEDGEKYSAFIAGAIWADRNPVNVWHDASEMPKEGEWILVQFDEDCYDTLVLSDLLTDIFYARCKKYGDIRWAYISNLLLKQLDNCKQSKEV